MSAIRFPVSYAKILERLDSITPADYARSRNFINGSVTYLSPYISRGVISTRQVLEKVLAKDYKPYTIQKFIQELAWRDYYQLVYKALGDGLLKDILHEQPGYTRKQVPVAINAASTGVNAIDTLIEKFYKTGYMHNHMRMYLASVTCNIAKVYWRQPSQWLYYHLLDGDIASNTCSWQWVAGSFSRKKYYCNQANVNRYTKNKQRDTFLDKPYPELVKMKVPEALKKTTHLKLITPLPQTKLPIIDIGKPTLIYTSYNIDPLWRKDEDVNRILLLEPSHFSKFPINKNVIKFIMGLSKNIPGIRVYTGEMDGITNQYLSKTALSKNIISKEHPAFTHYPGIKDERDWMFPGIEGFFKSYFQFWKKAQQKLMEMKVGNLD